MSMRQRFAGALLATGLLTAGLLATTSMISPGTAQARCDGVGRPVRTEFWSGGVLRASETPVSGTCNGNGTYQGVLVDAAADGACAAIQVQDGGNPWRTIATACTTGAPVPFAYSDGNGNSSVGWRLCAGMYGCTGRALNHGF